MPRQGDETWSVERASLPRNTCDARLPRRPWVLRRLRTSSREVRLGRETEQEQERTMSKAMNRMIEVTER
jgi:hypothetical protein